MVPRTSGWRDLLTSSQVRDVERVLAQEAVHRHHLVVALAGPHAAGFGSAHGPVALRAIHAVPTASLVGLDPPELRARRYDEAVDYESLDIGPALAKVLDGDADILERVFDPCVVAADAALDTLRPVVRAAQSMRLARYYRSLARSRLAAARRGPTATGLLEVFRLALTGAHLMRTTFVVTHLPELAAGYGFADLGGLIQRARAADEALDEPAEWLDRAAQAVALLDDALASSPLPAQPPNRRDVEIWLLELRARFLRVPDDLDD